MDIQYLHKNLTEENLLLEIYLRRLHIWEGK